MLRRSFVSLCVVMLLASAAAHAATTARMAGTVMDNEGLALPGVTVQISSDKLIGGPQIAITDVDGAFAFNFLPVGDYRVEAQLVGFQPAVAEGVRVALDRLAKVDFHLVPETFGGEIEVVAEVPVVDTAQVNTSVVFDEQFLQNAAVGAAGRDYLSVISQAAGVAGGGNASVYGGTMGDNSYLIDGLNTTDPLLGTFGTNFNYDAIQEMSFQTGGFEAEFGQATGGIINLVTKSGGNEFSGSLDIRYRNEAFIENGDHFNQDEQTSSSRIVSGTIGGPIMRDRLWFFVSLENVLTERQDEGAPVVRKFKGWNYIGKATWQISDNHRAVIKYSGDPAEIPGANSSRFITASGARTQEQGGSIYQAELNSVLTENMLFNAQIGVVRGFIESYPSSGDFNTEGHLNDDTDILSGAYPFSSFDDRDRDEYRAHLSYFVDDLVGPHEFKAGVEYNKLMYSGAFWINGDVWSTDGLPGGSTWQDWNGDGYYNDWLLIEEPLETSRDYTDSNGNITTFFLQDSWRPMPNLTIKPGIRLDTTVLDNHIGDQVADMDRWQPRFGFAWDINGDAKHVLRASWGRFMDPTALVIPNFASGVAESYNEYITLEYLCNSYRLSPCNPSNIDDIMQWVADSEGQPGRTWAWFINSINSGEYPTQLTNTRGITYWYYERPGAVNIYDPAQTLDQEGVDTLEAPYADELILAYETQIVPDASIEITYVKKKTEEIIEDTCVNNSWVWGDPTVQDPDYDNQNTWTSLSGCDYYLIANVPDFHRDYEAGIIKFETRKENFHILASYTNARSTGNTANGSRESYATGLADFFPVHFINQSGYMPDDRRHRLKFNGYLMLPRDFTIGLDAFWSSEGRITMQSSCSDLDGASRSQLDFYGVDPDMEDFCESQSGTVISGATIYLEPRGSTKTKSVWQVDLQVSKGFTVGPVDMQAVFTIQNLFNRELDATFNNRAFRQMRDDDYNLIYDTTQEYPILHPVWMPVGFPTSFWQPRRYEFGLRIEF